MEVAAEAYLERDAFRVQFCLQLGHLGTVQVRIEGVLAVCVRRTNDVRDAIRG